MRLLCCCVGGSSAGTLPIGGAGSAGSVGKVLSRGIVGTLRDGTGAIVLSCTRALRRVASCCWVVSGKSRMVLVVCGFFSKSTRCSNTCCTCSTGVGGRHVDVVVEPCELIEYGFLYCLLDPHSERVVVFEGRANVPCFGSMCCPCASLVWFEVG